MLRLTQGQPRVATGRLVLSQTRALRHIQSARGPVGVWRAVTLWPWEEAVVDGRSLLWCGEINCRTCE